MSGLPALSKRHQTAVDAFVENGGEKVEAYLTAYPHSMAWKPESIERAADKLFAMKIVQQHLAELNAPKPKAPKRKAPAKKKVKQVAKVKQGPPSKLTPEVRKLIANYLNEYDKEHKQPFPSIVGLAKVCRVARETVYEWARNPEHAELGLSDTLKVIHTFQQADIQHKAFLGEGHAAIARLILKSEHGFQETHRLEHTGEGGKPIQTAAMTINADMAPDEAAKVYRALISE